jgi:hypothetical protein
MNQPDSASDQVVADRKLADLLQSAPLPGLPASLEQAARRRIRQRMTQQFVLRTVAAGMCVVALWGIVQFTGNGSDQGDQRNDFAAIPLNDSELASLFAPPPVDPLAVLDRRQQVSYQTLKQLERGR